ncbi:hypothetical protein [Dactylosporangium sp. NPDC005555]|uniref:hypothetical protein n=1 Tax=Dactylosporangium sp. NPDC005555 TaxID=3154889 RepID=UPI0033A3AF08
MGASAWDYYVPYQPDINAALLELQAKVLADGTYYWAGGGAAFGQAVHEENRPTSMDDLWADETVQSEGTHSILDMERVVSPGERPGFASVEPVTPDEARGCAGTEILTREHAPLIKDLASRRWYGRCAVLHDPDGHPAEIYFFGYSGD